MKLRSSVSATSSWLNNYWECLRTKSSFCFVLVKLAKSISDEMKKDFCSNTSIAFHGEFARQISVPLSLCHNARYYLFAEEELVNAPQTMSAFSFVKLDNAKAQFKCPNMACQHAWTSMRARIAFSISPPDIGLIRLKILGQHCQWCHAYAHALWYIGRSLVVVLASPSVFSF